MSVYLSLSVSDYLRVHMCRCVHVEAGDRYWVFLNGSSPYSLTQPEAH